MCRSGAVTGLKLMCWQVIAGGVECAEEHGERVI
jgi:hypothetical protein